MDEDKTMLSALLAYLDDIDNQLKQSTKEHIWKGCTLPKERYRSFTNIKNVLNSLVKTTIRDINSQNDVSTYDGVRDNPSDSQSLISSDEYLAEIKNLLVLTSESNVLHNYLLTFQDLLGDMLYSVCQIINHHLTSPFRISVRDLEKLQKHYISISESLVVSTNNYTTNEKQDLSKEKDINESQQKIERLQKSLQICLKEMSKVKLEIEHYFKSKMIEMQFEQNNAESSSKPKGSMEENANSKIILTSDSNTSEKCILLNNNSNKFGFLEETKNNKLLYTPMNKSFKGTGSKPFKVVSQLQEDKKSSVFDSSTNTARTRVDNSKSSGDLFCHPLLYSDLLFLEAERLVMEANKKTFRCKSLPKIYSLESIAEETETEDSLYKKENIPTQENNTDQNNSQRDDSKKLNGTRNKQNSSDSTIDLFVDDEDDIFQKNEPLAMDVKAKISSLFDLLRQNQLSDEDLFKDCLNKSKNTLLLNSHERKLTENSRSADDSDINKSKDTFKFNQNKNEYDNGHKYKTQGDRQKPSKHIGKKEICSKTSLIELFNKKNTGLTSNTDPRHIEESEFPLWPVKAKYINVSGCKRSSDSSSDHSSNSISLGKSFEKSLYAIHLNKRYEQKQIYDGNLIVLETPNSMVKENSDYSLMDQSVFLFDVNHCEVNTAKFKPDNQGENNIISHFSTLKSNPPLPYPISILPNMNESFDIDKTMTVQFAQCGGVPYVAKQKNFQRRNYDFFNIDEYNNVNWNSFISIYTSKVGPSTRINQHRMFGKIINNMGEDQKQKNRLLNNVHTLTSNAGPFRLFDINGYPLTDSEGNVLKDPYGKSLVQLDSTGLPKNDIKVFDAAGNTPDDINFDPTQKPKTNCIIIKLNDNFNRPLHLFDKYGRPLTDSLGKLLVNVHGRPLLRFDNFGRPNTDYRGGPLYTDEGCKWSYQTRQSLSGNQFSEETVTAGKMATDLINQCGSSSSIKVDFNETSNVLGENRYEDYASSRKQKDNTFKLRTKDSDMWAKVENILQHLPKRKIFETKTSEANILVTNNCGDINPVEEILKPIIHHNNIIQRENCNCTGYRNIGNDKLKSSGYKSMNDAFFKLNNHSENEKTCLYFENYFKDYNTSRYESKPTEFQTIDNNNTSGYESRPTEFQTIDNNNTSRYESKPTEFQNIDNNMKNNKHLIDREINLINNFKATEVPISYLDSSGPFYNYLLNKETCSKCFVHKTLFNAYNPACLNFNQAHKDRLQERNSSLNYGLMATSTCEPKNYINKKVSNATFKKHDYLNNLCNEIIKQQFEYKHKVRTLQFDIDKKENWTDTSFTMITSSDDSKYTSEFPTITEIPNVSNGSTTSNLTKVQNKHRNYCHPYKNSETKNRIKKSKSSAQFLKSKHNHKDDKDMKDQNTSSTYPNDEKSLESDGTALSINVLNQDNEHYEIKVSEKKGINDKQEKCLEQNVSCANCSSSKNVSNYEQQKVVRDSLANIKQGCNMNRGKNHRCNTFTESKQDSPFRFNSDTNIVPIIAANDQLLEIKYVREQTNEGKSNLCTNKDNKSLNSTAQSHKYDNNNKYCTLPEKEILEEYDLNCIEPCQTILSDIKLNRFNRKRGNSFRRQTKECNIVAFLGNPVKYVLNKIDNRFPSRQNNLNKIYNISSRPNKESTKENKEQADFSTDSCCNYKNAKSKTNCMTIKEKFKHKDGLGKHGLLAFQSKSCIELTNQDCCFTMNYSGTENESQYANHGQVNCKDDLSKTMIRKCSSANCLIPSSGTDEGYLLKRSTGYQFNSEKQRNEHALVKQNALRKKHTSPQKKIVQSSKESKKRTHTKHVKPYEEIKKPNETCKKLVEKGKKQK